jgi:hypothetical protein
MASGSGTLTVLNTGLDAPRGGGAWQPAANSARRLARDNRHKNNTRCILLTNEDDTSPLSQQAGFRIRRPVGTILPASAHCRHIPRAMIPIRRSPWREFFPPVVASS